MRRLINSVEYGIRSCYLYGKECYIFIECDDRHWNAKETFAQYKSAQFYNIEINFQCKKYVAVEEMHVSTMYFNKVKNQSDMNQCENVEKRKEGHVNQHHLKLRLRNPNGSWQLRPHLIILPTYTDANPFLST